MPPSFVICSLKLLITSSFFSEEIFDSGIGADDNRIEQVRTFKSLLSPYGLHVFAKGGGGADLSPLRGYDNFFIGYRPESQRYFDFHHSARDNIDAIHPRSLEMGAASMSALYYLLDNLD